MNARDLALASILSASLPAQDRIEWFDDLPAARARAERERRPLLLLFRCEP